jgi:tetratricopeptide (TPR) repeat protein
VKWRYILNVMRRSAAIVVSVVALAAASSYSPRPDLDNGRYLKVLSEATARLALDPNDALALAAKSQALSALMRFGEAASLAQRSLDLHPNLADALLARGLARAGSAVQQRNFSSLRQISGAMDDLRGAVAADPTLQSAWLTLGVAYQQLPGLLGGSTRKALACAEALERLAPARGSALRGTVLSLDGNWPAADACFQKAFGLVAGDPQVVVGYLEALADKAAKKSLGAENQRSRLAAEARRLAPAVRSSGRGMEAVCGALLDAGLAEEAWVAAEGALKTADAPSLLRLQLGKLAARSGLHRSEGLAYLEQVLREPLEGGSGGYPAAHWRRGQILRDLGRGGEARRAAEAALSLDPKHPGARRLLDELG